MVSLKRKVLMALLTVDALMAIGFSFSGNGLGALRSWLLLNFIVVAFSLSIFFGLKLRKRRYQRKYKRSRYRHGFKKYDEDYYSNPQLTLDGDIVKSGGERLIANYFREHNIEYEYEKPAMDSSSRRISRPDFYLPEYNVYVEYWGMVNTEEHHKRQEYIKGMEWKMARYHENGLKFISVYPEDLGDLDSIFKSQLKK